MISVRPALSYAVAYGTTFEEFLLRAHDLGFTEVQLIPDQEPNLYSQFEGDRLRRLIDLKASLSMTIYMHNVFYDINPVSLVPDVRSTAFDITSRVMKLSCALGAENVTIHPGYMFGGWRRDEVQRNRFWRAASDALQRLADLSDTYNIPILLENGSYFLCTASGPGRTPLHLGITPEEVRELLDLSQNRIRLCLDINKAIRSEHPVSEFLATCGAAIGQLQVSTAPKYASEIREILLFLSQHRDSISVVLEGSLEEAKEAIELLHSLATQ